MPYKNKEDQAKSARKHYLANKEKMKARAVITKRQARRRNKAFVDKYLSLHPCVDCGMTNIIVLEFDHVNGKKEANIADAVTRGWSIASIEKEIAKCVVRCANCHRIVTHQRRNSKRKTCGVD